MSQEVKILGISGTPRKNGNTTKLVRIALESAESVPRVKTELYEMAGKEYHPCIGCLKCLDTGACVFKDNFQEFAKKYMEADGIIMGAPVYHMSVPGSMKAAIDRLGNSIICNFLKRGLDIPRYGKICGVLTQGCHRHGGEELTMAWMVSSCLVMNGVVVSGDTMKGDYIGAAGWTLDCSADDLKSKDVILRDELGIEGVRNLGIRVAEMTKIVKAGMATIKHELPSEYFYTYEEL